MIKEENLIKSNDRKYSNLYNIIKKYVYKNYDEYNRVCKRKNKRIAIIISLVACFMLIISTSILSIRRGYYDSNITAITLAIIFEVLNILFFTTFIFVLAKDEFREEFGFTGCFNITSIVFLIRAVFELSGAIIGVYLNNGEGIAFFIGLIISSLTMYLLLKNNKIINFKKALLILLIFIFFI